MRGRHRWFSALLLVLVSGTLPAGSGTAPALRKVEAGIREELRRWEAALERAAQEFPVEPARQEQTRAKLKELAGLHPAIIDVTFVDGQGIMRLVEPSAYRRHEGTDISAQAQIQQLRRMRKPVLSSVFRSVEGIDAADFEYPLPGGGQAFRGSLSILFRPAVLLEDVTGWPPPGTLLELRVIQPDGRVLYGPDPEESGRVVFSAPRYASCPEVRNLGRDLRQKREGKRQNTFPDPLSGRRVTWKTSWSTLEFRGAAWRLVLIQATPESAPPGCIP